MIGLNAGTIKVADWTPSHVNTETPSAPSFLLMSLAAISVNRAVGGSTSIVTNKDSIYTRSSPAIIHQDKQMNLLYIGVLPSPVSWTSSNETVATVDSDGFVTNLSSGSATIRATVDESYLQLTIAFSTSADSVSDEFMGYVSGSLGEHITNAVDTRLVGKTAANNMLFFTTQDHETATYIRNENVWPANLGASLCSISPWNSTGGVNMAGVAISPLHIIFSAHYQISSGATIRFVLSDNTVITRTMVSKLTHPLYVPYYPDITIGRLDSPLPDTIIFAKVLPDNYFQCLPNLGASTLPALCLDQEEKALVTDVYSLSDMASFTYPNHENSVKRAEFYENKINGDSGNPAFLIINNQLVILCVWTYGFAGAGTFITPHRNYINTMMSQLGGNYTLTDIDLSGFPTY